MVITQPSHFNTQLISLVFRCHLNTGLFANQTTFDHLNTGLVWNSDGYCTIHFLCSQIGIFGRRISLSEHLRKHKSLKNVTPRLSVFFSECLFVVYLYQRTHRSFTPNLCEYFVSIRRQHKICGIREASETA